MADGGASGPAGRGKSRVLCGVPKEKCQGSTAALSAAFRAKGLKIHNTHAEAMNCYKRYLISEGYEQLSSREFRNPTTKSIHVLTKQIRFGSKMRPGKAGRNMPNKRTGHACTSC